MKRGRAGTFQLKVTISIGGEVGSERTYVRTYKELEQGIQEKKMGRECSQGSCKAWLPDSTGVQCDCILYERISPRKYLTSKWHDQKYNRIIVRSELKREGLELRWVNATFDTQRGSLFKTISSFCQNNFR